MQCDDQNPNSTALHTRAPVEKEVSDAIRSELKMRRRFSSGFGCLTVGNSGSGSSCSFTETNGGRANILNDSVTQVWPTPCIDVLTNFIRVPALRLLSEIVRDYTLKSQNISCLERHKVEREVK